MSDEQQKDLTPEQEQQLEEVKQEWLDRLFNNPPEFNYAKIRQLVEWVYSLAEYDPPEVRVAASPQQAQLIANEAAGTDGEYYSFGSYLNVWDYGWVSFYDFFERIGVVDVENFITYRDMLKETHLYDTIQFDKMCIVVIFPEIISVDDDYQLHSENGPALRWPDGYELHFWHGTRVEKKWIETPEEITKDDIMNEDNVEKRRCIQEILGSDGFAERLGVVEIDRTTDDKGDDVVLLRSEEKDEHADDYIYHVKVKDATTDRMYYICVPPHDNAKEALSWTFEHEGGDPGDYQLDVET